MTKISDRVKSIIENEKVTVNRFSQVLGYERSQTIHDIINSKSNPSYDFFYKFVKSEYSEKYCLYWLITGEGEMYRTASDVGEESSSFDNTQEEIIQLLREKVSDQQKIIELLEEKVEILAGGNASTNIEAAAG
jgi:hypothetical protein